jgi:hypothetical protein
MGAAGGAVGAAAGASVVDAAGGAVGAAAGASVVDAADFFVDFFLAAGCSDCGARARPSRSRRVRTRSACASMSVEDGPFTPMPKSPQTLTICAVATPYSLANSWTRTDLGKVA